MNSPRLVHGLSFSLKELGTSRTHSAVIRCLTICQHIPVVRKNHKNQLTQQFDIICCLARCLALCTESKQIMSLLSCEPATLKTRSATLRSVLRTVSELALVELALDELALVACRNNFETAYLWIIETAKTTDVHTFSELCGQNIALLAFSHGTKIIPVCLIRCR